MTNFLKLTAASLLAISLAACATTDDRYKVGNEDDDKYSTTQEDTDVDLSDEQQFGMDDDDDFEAMSGDSMMMDNPTVGGAAMMSNKTIVANASAAPNLTTLVSLVQQAELVETLSGPGPFTVFAPTNTAFSALPSETTSMLMMDDNRGKLQNILKAHVVSGTVTADDLMASMGGSSSYEAQTLAGNSIKFYNFGDGLRIANADGTLSKINTADVMQSNGVVHVIDTVLVPK